MLDDFLTLLRPVDLLRLVALDAELRRLSRPFVDAIQAGVVALEESESSSRQTMAAPPSRAQT